MCWCFLFSSRRRHTRCALVTGVQTCALPILARDAPGRNAQRRAAEGPQMKPKHQRLILAIVALAGVAGAGVLGASALRDEAAYFRTPAEEIGRASCRERVCQDV